MTDRDTLLESQRLTAVRGLQLLDSEPELRFDRIARLAGAVFDMPIALISMVDAQRVWWKSAFGLPGLREVPREGSFCSAVVDLAESGAGLVTDPLKDCRFKKHLLTVEHHVRFYAGQPLFSKGLGWGRSRCSIGGPASSCLPSSECSRISRFSQSRKMRSIGLREALERLVVAERRAEEQHKRFSAFMDHLPNAAYIKDAEGRLFYLNPCWQQTFSLEPQAVLGKRDDEWLPQEVSVRTMRADRVVIETGQSTVTPETIPTRQGVRNWLTFRFPIPAAGGERLLGAVAVDMTAQAQTERALQELAMLQRAVLDTTAFSIISTEPDGIIRTFNAGSERLFGYRAREVVGKTTPTLFHDPAEIERHAAAAPSSSERDASPVRWGAEELASREAEWKFMRKDGTRFPAALSVTALRDGAGEVTGYVGVVQDLAERRDAQAELAAAQGQAEEAKRERAQLFTNLSEEVRAPLEAIVGVTALLLEAGLPPDHRQLAELVQGCAQGLMATVGDAADSTKNPAEILELAAIDFDPRRLMASVWEHQAARANERCLIVETEVAANVPAYFSGDPRRLRQILNHLTSGAVKQAAQGKITLSVTIQEMVGNDAVVLFAVTPDRAGAESSLSATSDPWELSCRQWIDRMGGTIGVKNEPGRSRCFFTARLRRAAGATGRLPEGAPETGGTPRRLRVLLAEDEAIHRLIATRQLEQAGCEIEAVPDGQRALEALVTGHFDLVLMDGEMPRMTGEEAAREIRLREGAERRTRIIALTNGTLPGERERCLALGMDGCLAKPMRAEELRAVLAEAAAPCGSSPSSGGLSGEESINPRTLAELRRECEEAWPELFGRYVQTFQEDAAEAREALARGAKERHADGLQQVARTLRAAAASFGAGWLILLCDQLEHEAAENLERALPRVAAILAELARVEGTLLAALSREPR